MTAGTGVGDAEREQTVAQPCRLPRREHQPDIGKKQAERGHQLHQVAVAKLSPRLEFAGTWAQARQGDREHGFPAMAQQKRGMRGGRQRLETPVGQPVQRPNPQPAKSRGVGTFRTFQPPVEIPLGAGGVQLAINLPGVGLLIHHQAVRAGTHHWLVFLRFHRPHFQRERGNELMQGRHAVAEVAVGHKLRMLPRDQQQVAKPLSGERPRFPDHLRHAQRHAEDGIVSGKAAVRAVVDAFIAQVQRREQADDPSKPLAGQGLGTGAPGFELLRGGRRQQGGEIGEGLRTPIEQTPDIRAGRFPGLTEQGGKRQRIELGDKTHDDQPYRESSVQQAGRLRGIRLQCLHAALT